MTATHTRTRPGREPGGASAPPPRRSVAPVDDEPAFRRTVIALVAGALAMLPLKGLFTDWSWLLDVWLTMIVVIAPAAVLRLYRGAGALDIWPGIVLLVPWLTARFVPQHALGGLIPTGRTWSDVSALLTDLHHTTRTGVAPVHSTVAIRLVLCALVGLLAALIDLFAVAGRKAALAGVPLLVIYTVSGAVPRRPVPWEWFVFAAAGFLILLSLHAEEDLDRWGRRFRSDRPRNNHGAAVSVSRIAVAAVVAAIVLPLVIPAQSRNLIADAFHDSGTGGSGFGGGSNGRLSPFAELQGQLRNPEPTSMAVVHVLGHDSTEPYYLRVNVLSDFTGSGWQVSQHGDTESIGKTTYDTEPVDDVGTADTAFLQAQIRITGLRGNAPVFVVPSSITGLPVSTTWSPQDQLLLGREVTGSTTYTESFYQPEPTIAQLSAVRGQPDAELAPYLELPASLPAYARDLVQSLTAKTSGPYAAARAINDYFTNPANGFQYDIKTTSGDSGSALVDFLKNKRGFCQQFAAAMGVMLRDAGIPSRVVLGYMHPATDGSGNFTVTSSDAHAWVEAYFAGIGWIPFDPTPATGLVGGSSVDTAWAPHSYGASADGNGLPNKASLSNGASSAAPTSAAPTTAPARAASDRSTSSLPVATLLWLVAGIAVVLLVLTPAAVRTGRRRRRYRAARREGDADALWAELSDTALDLGYVWSSARSPRQVARWLERDAGRSAPALQRLAIAVERGRYGRPAPGDGDGSGAAGGSGRALAENLHEVTGSLRARRSLRTRAVAALWPASLGWGGRRRGAGRRRR